MATKKKATTRKAALAKPAKKAAAKKSASAKRKASKSSDMKTKPTPASVEAFVAKVANPVRRKDAEAALTLMKKVTGKEPTMWGPSIVGYGSYHYKYDSGREGDMCMTGFSPRSGAMVFYVIGGVPATDDLYKKLGKHKLGGSCLYINKLADIDLGVLEKIIAKSVAYMKKTYGAS
jgi:hypothetical protein